MIYEHTVFEGDQGFCKGTFNIIRMLHGAKLNTNLKAPN